MIRSHAPILGLLAALTPAVVPLAHAQTNLDQGKSAAQIFAGACVECHKAPHGLAKGKSIAAVTDFLHEHYTTSREQAAALAAYVLGGRGGDDPVGRAQGRGQKPAAERASASAEEPKPAKHQAKRSPKAEEGKPANAKLRRPAPEQAEPKDEPKDEPSGGEQPNIVGPEGGRHEHRSATAAGSRRREPKTAVPPQEPAAVAHAPAAVPAETAPSQEASPGPPAAPSAAAPTDAASGDSGENAPVPRDNVPD